MRSQRKLTSVGVGELGAAEEAQVARPGPDRLSVSKTESGVEVIGLQDLLAVTAVVTAAVMSAVHPDLQEGRRTPPSAAASQTKSHRDRKETTTTHMKQRRDSHSVRACVKLSCLFHHSSNENNPTHCQ